VAQVQFASATTLERQSSRPAKHLRYSKRNDIASAGRWLPRRLRESHPKRCLRRHSLAVDVLPAALRARDEKHADLPRAERGTDHVTQVPGGHFSAPP